MKRHIFATLIVLILTLNSHAAPKPAIVQSTDDWTVNVTFDQPQQIIVKVPGCAQPTRFWYTILSLTNNSPRDVDFYPRCELMTDTFQIIPAGTPVSDIVFQQIKLRYQARYPFLESINTTTNRVLQGSDNTKDIAIIWQDFDPMARAINLYITGLSNETAVVNHPTAKNHNGRPLKVFLRKTLELSYNIGGDPIFRSDATLDYTNRRWIMR